MGVNSAHKDSRRQCSIPRTATLSMRVLRAIWLELVQACVVKRTSTCLIVRHNAVQDFRSCTIRRVTSVGLRCFSLLLTFGFKTW